MRVCPNYKQDKICLYSNDYNGICSLAIAHNWLKDKTASPSPLSRTGQHRGCCNKQGMYFRSCFPKQGQDFKHSAARLYPNIAQATRSPDVSLGQVHVPDIQIRCFLCAHKTYLISPTTSGGSYRLIT